MSRDIVPIHERDLFSKDPFFSTTWDEFDKMRQDMMSKSKDFWDNCNKDMSNFDEAVRKSHSDMDMGMAPFRPQLPAWAMPDSMKDKWMPMMKTRNDEVSLFQYSLIHIDLCFCFIRKNCPKQLIMDR